MNSKEALRIANGLKLLEEKEQRAQHLNLLSDKGHKYKKEVINKAPFSLRLNEFITNWYHSVDKVELDFIFVDTEVFCKNTNDSDYPMRTRITNIKNNFLGTDNGYGWHLQAKGMKYKILKI